MRPVGKFMESLSNYFLNLSVNLKIPKDHIETTKEGVLSDKSQRDNLNFHFLSRSAGSILTMNLSWVIFNSFKLKFAYLLN